MRSRAAQTSSNFRGIAKRSVKNIPPDHDDSPPDRPSFRSPARKSADVRPAGRNRQKAPGELRKPAADHEPGAGRWYPGLAVRYSNSFGAWDAGVYQFHGLAREPSFGLALDAAGAPVLAPFYEIVNQTGADVQYTAAIPSPTSATKT